MPESYKTLLCAVAVLFGAAFLSHREGLISDGWYYAALGTAFVGSVAAAVIFETSLWRAKRRLKEEAAAETRPAFVEASPGPMTSRGELVEQLRRPGGMPARYEVGGGAGGVDKDWPDVIGE